MNEKIRQVLVIIATIGTIIFNWLAATGVLGGVATNVISDKYPTNITPAGYAFAIWSLIYLGLIVFSIYQALPKNAERFRSLRTVYILSCVFNCAWLYFWHQEAILVCLGVITLLLGNALHYQFKTPNNRNLRRILVCKIPFRNLFRMGYGGDYWLMRRSRWFLKT